MKLTTVTATVLLGACASLAHAATPPASAVSTASAADSSQPLDIAKVISITAQDPNRCGLVKANMRYIDSQGITRSLDYSREGNGCRKR
jgi:hypothetical protein